MAKNANFLKIFSLVITVLSTVAKLVKDYTDTENDKVSDTEE